MDSEEIYKSEEECSIVTRRKKYDPALIAEIQLEKRETAEKQIRQMYCFISWPTDVDLHEFLTILSTRVGRSEQSGLNFFKSRPCTARFAGKNHELGLDYEKITDMTVQEIKSLEKKYNLRWEKLYEFELEKQGRPELLEWIDKRRKNFYPYKYTDTHLSKIMDEEGFPEQCSFLRIHAAPHRKIGWRNEVNLPIEVDRRNKHNQITLHLTGETVEENETGIRSNEIRPIEADYTINLIDNTSISNILALGAANHEYSKIDKFRREMLEDIKKWIKNVRREFNQNSYN